ncbi:hypothetical protein ACU80C_11885 [Bacillus mycoides]|uniref:hypothetical protein n=1 Tax=Bacillus mycoides TaxID=1405 RepID=UPI00065BA8BC|nr:hypothetical protein [Bacillus mycoides]KMQ17875.1 hypothetical protein TU70_10805 [Bacillus mycoides]QWH97187.1 hypothetical protein EXW36_11660 [Bacillus mycoides]
MDPVDKEQAEKAFQTIVDTVSKAWNAVKTVVQGIGAELIKKAREMQPFLEEVQRLETKRTKRRRQVTYRKKRSQAKRKAWKKYSLQGRGRKH